MSEILLIDDDEAFRDSLAQSLRIRGFAVREFGQAQSALAHIKPLNEVIVVTDIRMPKMSGETLRERVHALDPDVPVLLMTGHGDVSMAVGNLKAGAFSFLSKPLDLEETVEDCRRALTVRQAVVEKRKLAVELSGRNRLFEQIQGSSKLIQDVRRHVSALAARDTNVLILGETGAGKEVVARALHAISEHSMQPFVAVNALLIDDPAGGQSLFGDDQGPGLFERAGEGTLFLDKIEELAEQTQSKLLRVLEERRYRTGNAPSYSQVRCRIVCAAKPALADHVVSGRFRDDLYYRLRSDLVEVPPLRSRKADSAMLFEHFARLAAQQANLPERQLSPQTLAWVMSQDWPANVRELKDAANRWGLGESLGDRRDGSAQAQSLSQQVAEFERTLVLSTLEAHNFDIRATAEALQTPRKTLTDKIAKYGLAKSG